MADHTPGPWTFDPNLDPENEPVIWSPAGLNVATVETGAACDETQIIANANLIAAAPDLLAACEWLAAGHPSAHQPNDLLLRRRIGQTPGENITIDVLLAARAAIAKAKGETS